MISANLEYFLSQAIVNSDSLVEFELTFYSAILEYRNFSLSVTIGVAMRCSCQMWLPLACTLCSIQFETFLCYLLHVGNWPWIFLLFRGPGCLCETGACFTWNVFKLAVWPFTPNPTWKKKIISIQGTARQLNPILLAQAFSVLISLPD